MTLEESVRQRIRGDIICGQFSPDAKLRISDLSLRYEVGSTPVREALSRLVPEGLVTSEGNKGFRVAPVSIDSLHDLTRARQVIEGEAFLLSMKHGDDDWEAEIVGRYHLLSKDTHYRDSGGNTDFEKWEVLHKSFHRALLSGCGGNTLLDITDRLYDLGRRYRYFMLSMDPINHDLVAEQHKQLMEAALTRNVAEGADLLRAHLGLTTQTILTSVGAGEEKSNRAEMEHDGTSSEIKQ